MKHYFKVWCYELPELKPIVVLAHGKRSAVHAAFDRAEWRWWFGTRFVAQRATRADILRASKEKKP